MRFKHAPYLRSTCDFFFLNGESFDSVFWETPLTQMSERANLFSPGNFHIYFLSCPRRPRLPLTKERQEQPGQ